MGDLNQNTEKSCQNGSPVTLSERRYKSAITVPVFGQIPLHLSEMIEDLKVRENPPLWAQFFKYVVFGFIATGVLGLVYVIARMFFGDYIADDLPKETLKSHLGRVMLVAFVFANIVAYITNRMFVFTPSNRHWTVEFMIFLAVSGLSFWAGNSAKDWFIDAGLHKDVAALSFAISSALVNFIARKYLVFDNSPKSIITD